MDGYKGKKLSESLLGNLTFTGNMCDMKNYSLFS